VIRTMRKRLPDVIAFAALAAIALGVAYYILQNQRLRLPLLEDAPFQLKGEFSTGQAVTPGQGQTIRVSGVRVGDIAKVELREGRAIITMDFDSQWSNLVHRDATALLRPKTGLKDMFIQLNPGSKQAPLLEQNETIPIHATAPDVNPDEILAGLDADTRDYLKLLVGGAGRGLTGRGEDLRATLKRFEPTYRDLARVQRTVSKRQADLRRLITALADLNDELAGKGKAISELVVNASRTFGALASERSNVSSTVRELPSTLEQATSALDRVDVMARILRPAADNLRPVAAALTRANKATTPFAREAAPLLRTPIRPFVRELRPLVRDLNPAARDLVRAEPVLTRSLTVLNHLFNMLGHNPGGRQGPEVAAREEGYLFHLAWLGHQSVNLFTNADAHGPVRTLTTGGTCATLAGTAKSAPGVEFILGLTGALTDPRVCGGTQPAARTRISDRAR
jgi:phospholipid/cholesterol/gamma-HCH transport system substrate-binding protein